MKASKPQSAETRGANLTPEQRREGDRNLARLLVIAKRQSVPAAIEELHRIRAEKRTKAPNSQAAS